MGPARSEDVSATPTLALVGTPYITPSQVRILSLVYSGSVPRLSSESPKHTPFLCFPRPYGDLIFVAVPLYFVAQRQAHVAACDSSHQAVAPTNPVPGQAIGPDRSTSLSDRPMTREKWTGNGAES